MMKKLFMLVEKHQPRLMMMAAVLFCCTSCVRVNLGEIGKLKPSENIVKNEYTMQPFSKVCIDLTAKVKIVQRTEGDNRVLLRCPDNYVDLFEFTVDDDVLKLGFAEDMHKSIEVADMAIIVCSPTLLHLHSEGVGMVLVDSLTTPSLHIESEGVGKITVRGLEVETLKVESSGVGNIVMTGKAKRASYECSGVGSINADGLKAMEVMAEVNGVGSISCFASESLNGEVNGIGSLKYNGKPKQKKLQRNGVGSIGEGT